MRISDWSSDVCSSDLRSNVPWNESSYSNPEFDKLLDEAGTKLDDNERRPYMAKLEKILQDDAVMVQSLWRSVFVSAGKKVHGIYRSEEHTSELQSIMRNSYAVFCLKKKNKHTHTFKNIY